MEAAGEGDRVLPVGALDAEPVGRGLRNARRLQRGCGWRGGRRRGGRRCLLAGVHLVLQVLELLLHRLDLLLELIDLRRDRRPALGRAGRRSDRGDTDEPRACESTTKRHHDDLLPLYIATRDDEPAAQTGAALVGSTAQR